MIGAVLITIALLAGFWVYIVPLLQGAIPSQYTGNKWVQFGITGVLLLVTVLVVGKVIKLAGVKAIASA